MTTMTLQVRRGLTLGQRARKALRVIAPVAHRLYRRAQRPVLTISGFGLVTLSAWDLSRPLGLLAGGASCLIIEALTKGDSR